MDNPRGRAAAASFSPSPSLPGWRSHNRVAVRSWRSPTARPQTTRCLSLWWTCRKQWPRAASNGWAAEFWAGSSSSLRSRSLWRDPGLRSWRGAVRLLKCSELQGPCGCRSDWLGTPSQQQPRFDSATMQTCKEWRNKSHQANEAAANQPVWTYEGSLRDPGWISPCRPRRCYSQRQSVASAWWETRADHLEGETRTACRRAAPGSPRPGGTPRLGAVAPSALQTPALETREVPVSSAATTKSWSRTC